MPELTPEYASKRRTPNAQLVSVITGKRLGTYESAPKEIAIMLALSELALIAFAYLSPDREERRKSRHALQIRRAARVAANPLPRIFMRSGSSVLVNGR